MNVFFYTALRSQGGENYVNLLRQYTVFAHIKVIPSGCKFNTPMVLDFRSGDIMILYAANEVELDGLLELRDKLKSFRVIVILWSNDSVPVQIAYLLRPCFLTCFDDPIDEVEAVIRKVSQIIESDGHLGIV